MKVCTDSCLLGALVANKLALLNTTSSKILDIGSGTGLLSLMVAQKTSAEIHAVEYDEAAAVQSEQNFRESPFSERIRVFNKPIQEFQPAFRYDYIICNPPFYEESLPSPDKLRNIAMHSHHLNLDQLLGVFKKFLLPTGSAYLLIPFTRTGETETMALRQGLHVEERILIRHSKEHPFTRSILQLNLFRSVAEKESELEIREANGEYTQVFRRLLKDYYLYL